MSYQEPKEGTKAKPVPPAAPVVTSTQYNKKVKPAAKPAPADGYMNSGTTKDKFGM